MSQSGPRGNQPYARHQTNQVVEATSLAGPAHPVKASSTTSEFTKRKNWSQHIIDEIQVSRRSGPSEKSDSDSRTSRSP